jgi:hypothetical protein
LDPRTSRWISGDPALGEYIPGAPVNDEVRKQNQNLPGGGGIFNLVNLHVYHYAGNNPVKYTDPDGRFSFDEETGVFTAEYMDNADLVAALVSKVQYDSQYGTSTTMKIYDGNMPVASSNNNEDLSAYISNNVNSTGGVSVEGVLGNLGLSASAIDSICNLAGIEGKTVSKIATASNLLGGISTVIDIVQAFKDPSFENKLDIAIDFVGFAGPTGLFLSLSVTGAKLIAPYAAKSTHILENYILDYTAEMQYGIKDFSKMVGR